MSVGAVTALTLVLSAPAVHGMVVGTTTPFEASVRLLAALLVAMVVEAVLRGVLPASRGAAGEREAVAGLPRQRTAPDAVVPQAIPAELADRLRAGD